MDDSKLCHDSKCRNESHALTARGGKGAMPREQLRGMGDDDAGGALCIPKGLSSKPECLLT